MLQRIHTRARTHTDTLHTWAHTHTQTHTHTITCTCTHRLISTHTHAGMYPHKHTCVHIIEQPVVSRWLPWDVNRAQTCSTLSRPLSVTDNSSTLRLLNTGVGVCVCVCVCQVCLFDGRASMHISRLPRICSLSGRKS